jgi:large conductance mechanosensitive channel
VTKFDRKVNKGRILMKKFFEEFKKFITRGNVVDMAVGVIVGGAFTAIVNGMSNFILKPIVNWFLALILGANTLSELYTMLKPAYKDILDEAGAIIGRELDLAQSIYIDWGSFINAVINFFIIAFVLFIIVKIINKFRESSDSLMNKINSKKLTKEQRAEIEAAGIKRTNRKAIDAYFAEKQRLADEKAAAEAAEAAAKAAEAARLEREANPTSEDLLKLILAELKNK